MIMEKNFIICMFMLLIIFQACPENVFALSSMDVKVEIIKATKKSNIIDPRLKDLVNEIEWHDEEAIGKLDFLVNLNFRMDSTANYSDVVLPAAFWYEKYDVTFGDMHTFVHPLTPATKPPWEPA